MCRQKQGDWPVLGSIPSKKGANRRLTMAPGNLGMAEQGCSAYRPSTYGGWQLERLQLVEGIRQHLLG